MKSKSVFGIYKSRPGIEAAVDSLKLNGFEASDISVLLPDSAGAQDLALIKGSKAAEGAAAGAGTGAVVGGALGWLVGLGLLSIPGVGPLIAAGPLVSALAGMGVVGTVAGLSGAIVGFGIPEYEAKRYEGSVRDGGMLLSVHVEDNDLCRKAMTTLAATGAEDISTTSEVRSQNYLPPRRPYDSDRYTSPRV